MVELCCNFFSSNVICVIRKQGGRKKQNWTLFSGNGMNPTLAARFFLILYIEHSDSFIQASFIEGLSRGRHHTRWRDRVVHWKLSAASDRPGCNSTDSMIDHGGVRVDSSGIGWLSHSLMVSRTSFFHSWVCPRQLLVMPPAHLPCGLKITVISRHSILTMISKVSKRTFSSWCLLGFRKPFSEAPLVTSSHVSLTRI